ncbi:MAG: hypothetical protein FJZ01_26320, partial [Candidatus Sericytochromatia bacterium]|nr:hypothetical protein [Candidatus Tanganyikabacteria bacterium]
MPGRLTRIAVTGLAATLVGCIVAPRGTEPPAPGGPAAVSPDGARAVSLPGVPFGSGEVDKSRVAYVTFTIGSPRQVQDIPAGTKAIGISLKSASGTNLIKSAKCGSDNFCYKPGIGMAMFAYTSDPTF